MSSLSRVRLAITAGDPAGIGPDIVLKALDAGLPAQAIIFCDRATMEQRAAKLGLKFDLPESEEWLGRDAVIFSQIDVACPVEAGNPDAANACHVLDQLHGAHRCAEFRKVAAIVTGPVSKANVSAALPGFKGHTGFFAQQCDCEHPVMAFFGPRLSGALVTAHVPLARVPKMITAEAVARTLQTADQGMRRLAGKSVRWTVCGLNPHAGEGGLLGKEDRDEIVPGIERARAAGVDAHGPVSADAAFLQKEGCVLAMYHDQLLPVLKRDAFAENVNVTFGMSYPRTSVGHGTAYELAGTGKADCSSLLAAVRAAAKLAEASGQ